MRVKNLFSGEPIHGTRIVNERDSRARFAMPHWSDEETDNPFRAYDRRSRHSTRGTAQRRQLPRRRPFGIDPGRLSSFSNSAYSGSATSVIPNSSNVGAVGSCRGLATLLTSAAPNGTTPAPGHQCHYADADICGGCNNCVVDASIFRDLQRQGQKTSNCTDWRFC
jgi:hypothetical protein